MFRINWRGNKVKKKLFVVTTALKDKILLKLEVTRWMTQCCCTLYIIFFYSIFVINVLNIIL